MEIFPGGKSGIAINLFVNERINPEIPVIIIDIIIANERFFQSIFIQV
jgi:hypothetical protein